MSSSNDMAMHRYKDGHVTHNWQQSKFLDEAFAVEDNLRAEVEEYGHGKHRRSSLLDWKIEELSERNNKKGIKSKTARDSGRSCSCKCRCHEKTCRSTTRSRSYSSMVSSTGRTSEFTTARTDVTSRIDDLRARKQRLEERLAELEDQLEETL